ncbi:SH3 domain-binding glutamic acid-rich protein homolog isoform X3 [Drosophila pseudoobscura]|uniref:SH3 domain-binding glutamic acid-rich protein homolog isoform X3 n=1 Tax=Drosophila pseudoobscura pseudoobscura TaxID=46245 RepID=A0A6I8WA63_DROPS|nr:SH3 domain-binding glutamic acid-rich protein homolog isoform X3 [Drosophila pseudoobscura]
MVLKVYVSGMSGNKEVKKRQQRVLMILDSKNIQYDTVDITEPGKEGEKEMMQNKSTSNGGTVSDPDPRHPLPPQIFNDADYCGDYDAFDMANEIDTLEVFLKLAPADTTAVSSAQIELKQENGDAKKEVDGEKEKATEKDEAAPAEDAAAEANGEAGEKPEKKDEDGAETSSEDKEKAEGEGADAKEENGEEKRLSATTTTTTAAAAPPSVDEPATDSDRLLESERAATAQ